MRWESGHAYHQILRSAPRGLDTNELLRNLFYGWDVRKQADVPYASDEEMIAFAKMLIFVHMVRNELLFAPQITKTDARYAPADQSRSFSEAYVRTSGSKSKFSELYQWAVLMPHLQGVLLYIIIIGYPFACMLMVLPGYWKAFFTWVSFFAWLKLWDVGFAIVQVLERSVWGMIGNRSSMSRLANMMIQTATSVGSVGVSCPEGSEGPPPQDGDDGALSKANLSQLCAIPDVCSVSDLGADCPAGGAGQNQTKALAWQLFDKALLMGAGVDLDLSNGYYIYIMSALYFAVPAVTGQLVLGAKSGVANMVSGAIGGVTGEAGKAAATGYQHAAVNAAQTNAASVGQAAYAKAMRKGGLATEILEAGNEPLRADLEMQGLQGKQKHKDAKAKELGTFGADRRSAADAAMATMNMASLGPKLFAGELDRRKAEAEKGGGGGGGGSGAGAAIRGLNEVNSAQLDAGNKRGQWVADHAANKGSIKALKSDMDTHWNMADQSMRKAGAQASQGRLSQGAEFAAQTAAWEAKNAFASHAASQAGIAGMNAGNLSPGQKPQSIEGMAFSGELDSYAGGRHSAARSAAMYPLSFYQGASKEIADYRKSHGGSTLGNHYGGGWAPWSGDNSAGKDAIFWGGKQKEDGSDAAAAEAALAPFATR